MKPHSRRKPKVKIIQPPLLSITKEHQLAASYGRIGLTAKGTALAICHASAVQWQSSPVPIPGRRLSPAEPMDSER